MVIYRKYRPQQFNDVVGQENIIKVLKGALKRDGIGHAYLFSGPRGTGKTTIARILAKAVNCHNLSKDFEPCNKCSACVEIGDGRSLDFIEIDAASNRGIDEIRQLRDGINFSPAKNKYRVFILDEVHMLTKEAFNALLKTLEEPPAHAIFILATTEIHKIPATIISRCQRFNFTRIFSEKIANLLADISKQEKIQAERPAFEVIARNCDGCIRDAESVFGQIAMMSQGKITLENTREMLGLPDQEALKKFSKSVLSKDVSESIKQIDAILQEGKDLYIFTTSLVSYLRAILMLKISSDLSGLVEKDYGAEDLQTIKEISASTQKSDIAFALKKIVEVQDKMRYSDFPNLYLELAVAEIALFGKEGEGLSNEEESDNIRGANKVSRPVSAESYDGQGRITTQISRGNVENDEKLGVKSASQKEDRNQDELLQLVQERWEEVLIKVKEKNHSVHAFLKICSPAKISRDELYVAVGYQFHKERLNTTQNRMIIEAVVGEVLDAKLRIKPFTEKELADMGIKVEKSKVHKVESPKNTSPEQQEDLLSEALKMFGGQVVET